MNTILVFGDVHIPYQNQLAVDVFCNAAEYIRPKTIICLGDLLDCYQFSSYPPVWGVPETKYQDDIKTACDLLDRLRNCCERLVFVEGNHEYRLNRWAARTNEGRGVYSMLSPRTILTQGRDITYIQYGGGRGNYPHYPINKRIVAVHGWSYAKNATRQHLMMSQGRSVIHGHVHTADVVMVQNIWSPNRVIQARGAGCLCKLIPLYGTGRPVNWVHAFILGYLGRRSDTLYTIPIMENRCILPGGIEISAKEKP